MRALIRLCASVALLAAALVWPAVAAADHETRPSFELRALGHSPNPASFLMDPEGPAPAEINSDLAFWGNFVFHGNYDGFRIIDASDPQAPVEISHTRCQGNQGDIVVWENILVRSWNSPAPGPTPEFPGDPAVTCDGQPVPPGWEGVHVFDISNKADPQLLASVELPCGSHTATAVPDVANGRLIVYNQTSGGPCFFFDIIEVPLAAPQTARLVRQQPLEGEHACHDSGVILGDVNLMACASGHMANVFDIGENEFEGGSLLRPEFLYSVEEEGVGPPPGSTEHEGNWHSAAFTWDGEVLILGWEPGGGAEPECEATDPPVTHSAFFYDAKTGEKLGQWELPFDQTAEENCTIHNYNVVPIRNRYILVSGNYQAGTWVTDFTDPSRAFTRAFADPPAIVPTQLGGSWSSYWYNRLIYESSITEGLNIYRYQEGNIRRQSLILDHLNPQTQEFSLEPLSASPAKVAKERRAARKALRSRGRH
jgi:LVIVD repeat